jgi:hypothetical protein
LARFLENLQKNEDEKLREFWWFSDLDLNSVMVKMKTVTIMFIYVRLMMFLILISENAHD